MPMGAAALAKDHMQIRMCLTKDRYDRKEAAESAIPHRESKTGRVLRSYSCPYCGGYHLTKTPLEEYLAAA